MIENGICELVQIVEGKKFRLKFSIYSVFTFSKFFSFSSHIFPFLFMCVYVCACVCVCVCFIVLQKQIAINRTVNFIKTVNKSKSQSLTTFKE